MICEILTLSFSYGVLEVIDGGHLQNAHTAQCCGFWSGFELAGQKIGKVHIAEPRNFLGYVVESKVLDPYIVVPCKFVLEQWYQNLVPQRFVVSISTHFSRLYKNKYISLSARDNDTLDHVMG